MPQKSNPRQAICFLSKVWNYSELLELPESNELPESELGEEGLVSGASQLPLAPPPAESPPPPTNGDSSECSDESTSA